MIWNFLKKILKKSRIQQAASPVHAPFVVEPPKAEAGIIQPPASAPERPAIAGQAGYGIKRTIAPAADEKTAPVKEKSPAEKTDEELAREINSISPEILSQAKTPQARKLVINIYRKMLIEGVDINNEKEVKKWLKEHPEVVKGGETHKIATFKREEPKVGRNDACPCGSGNKYKKCCGHNN